MRPFFRCAVAEGAVLGVALTACLLTLPAYAEEAAATLPAAASADLADPRAGDAAYEQAKRLLDSIDDILEETAAQRADSKKLPSEDDFLVPPVFTETKEDREDKVRALLDSALGVVTDVPIVDLQKAIEERRRHVREIEEQIGTLRQRQLTAPRDALMPGVLNDTVDSLQKEIDDLGKRIEDNKLGIQATKGEIQTALSMNASWGQRAGIRQKGVVRYIGWAVPEAVYIDYDILKSAPPHFNWSGIGDILCNHTGVLDWRYATERGFPARAAAYDEFKVELDGRDFHALLEESPRFRAFCMDALAALLDQHL